MNFKKLSLLLIITCKITVGLSQNVDFPEDSASWKYIFFEDPWSSPTFEECNLFGDTIIASQNYQILEKGFMRTENKRVYFLPKDSSQSYLLYDFNLELGDVFLNKWPTTPNGPDTIIVDQIDSILTNFGYRKRWRFATGGDWIDGIGSTWSLTNPIYESSVSGVQSLLCFKNEEELIIDKEVEYSVGGYYFTAGCDNFSVGIDENTYKEVFISPNPFQDRITLHFPEVFSVPIVEIYNLKGQHIITTNQTKNINLTSIPRGIYFLVFTMNHRKHATKIIKL